MLNSFGTIFQSIGQNITGFFVGFQDPAFAIISAVECLLVFALVYYVSKVLRDSDATHIMCIYWALLLVVGVMRLFGAFSGDLFFVFVMLSSVFFLLLFATEVKKSIWAVHEREKRQVELTSSRTEMASAQDVERTIADVIKAVQNMSKNNVGALLVLSKGTLPKQVMQSGVMLDAEISPQLIEGIFFPKSPLHDGALILRGHKILAAGCFLPLTQKLNYPKDFGTRHRAAIGITEVANVVSIVVSEETGIVSVVKQGNVQRYADYDVLKNVLRDYYWHELPLYDKKR